MPFTLLLPLLEGGILYRPINHGLSLLTHDFEFPDGILWIFEIIIQKMKNTAQKNKIPP